MENKRNYYRILHVQPDAPVELITSSYRTMMQKMKMHPDLGGDEWDASVINEAYTVLSDSQKRAEYDRVLFGDRRKAEAAHQNSAQRTGEFSSASNSTGSHKEQQEKQREPGSVEIKSVEPQRTTYSQPPASPASMTECAFCQEPFNGAPNQDTNCIRCKSPLLAIIPQQYEKEEQRKIERIPAYSKFEFIDQWPGSKYQGSLLNLSLNGLQFQTNVLLADGVRIRIESVKFVAVAEITNQRALGNELFIYGGRFITLRFFQQSGSFLHIKV